VSLVLNQKLRTIAYGCDRFITQTYYGSIGYATPAALGAEVALKELHNETGAPRGRTLLFTGDGSMQLTMQEIGTMVTYGFKPILIILNNNGYTIERVIHGARQKYNDINIAKYEHMLPFFGHSDPQQSYRRVVTKEDFGQKVLGDKALVEPQSLQVVELVLDAFDVPWRLTKILSLRGPAAVKKLEEAGFIGEGKVGIGA
jgi:pyruvate decarboxylase